MHLAPYVGNFPERGVDARARFACERGPPVTSCAAVLRRPRPHPPPEGLPSTRPSAASVPVARRTRARRTTSNLASRAPIAKDSADCRAEDRRAEFADSRCRELRSPRSTHSLADSESAHEMAQNASLRSF
eukprot:15046801-Alexandrium_andersonii.AAC.1